MKGEYWLTKGSGNHMVEQAEQKPDPDDYVLCYECGENWHRDYLIYPVTVEDGKEVEICVECFERRYNEFQCIYSCSSDGWGEIGVPIECPFCGSHNIFHESIRGTALVREKQKGITKCVKA